MLENITDNKEKELLFKKMENFSKISNNSLNNNLRSSIKKNNNIEKAYSSKKVKIILPNLSKNNVSNIINNQNVKKDNISNNSINDSSYNRINIKVCKSFIQKVSIPSLKKFDKNIKEYSKKNINFSNRNLNKSVYLNKDNYNIQKNRENIRNNLLSNRSVRFGETNFFKNRYREPKVNQDKNILNLTNKNKDNENVTKSTFHISKIKLNDALKDNKLTQKLNISQSCKNFRSLNYYFKHNSSIINLPNKHSNFFKLSQKDNVSARRIYRHYLKKSAKEIIQPIKNYKKFFDDRNKNFFEKLSRIYCENQKYLSIIKEIKDNKKIAFKNDFNIEEYQSTIVELMDQRVSQKYLIDLQNEYRTLNKKIFGVIEPKGRFTILAEKLRYNLPLYLLERLKQLDKDTIISRMKYYNRFKKFKKENKLVSRFVGNKKKNNSFNNNSVIIKSNLINTNDGYNSINSKLINSRNNK